MRHYKDESIDYLRKIKKEKGYKYNRKVVSGMSDRFKTLKELVDYIKYRRHIPDTFTIDGVPFTMEVYDMEGVEIYWGNKLLEITVEIEWANRYENISSITHSTIYKSTGYRKDLTYLE